MQQAEFRDALRAYIEQQAQPREKFSHQPRLYHLACQIAGNKPVDDEVLFAAAWLHDLGVFVGHRPEEPAALAQWDHIGYACRQAPALLEKFGFPVDKITAVLQCIQTHLPSSQPGSFEGQLLRDADILEQLGAVGILRNVCKIGRDTRFHTFSDALRLLRRNLDELPGKLQLESARELAEPRIRVLRDFLEAAAAEADGQPL